MKAVRVIPHPEGGRIEVQEIARPVVGAGQVLVRVRASGLNRGEITQARDKRSGEPLTAGVEFAGEIAEVGSEVKGWRAARLVAGGLFVLWRFSSRCVAGLQQASRFAAAVTAAAAGPVHGD